MKTQADCWRALLEGESLHSPSPYKVVKLDSHGRARDQYGDTWAFDDPEKWEVYLPRWYDQILEGGVLCWVWTYDQNQYRHLAVITEYDKQERAFGTVTSAKYKHAQPLTRAELQTLLENVPEE